MSGSPLVAGAVDTATPLSGTGLLDDGAQLVHAIESGDWLAGGLSAFAVGVDTVAAVSDPLGSLIASGLGWLIDHLEPIKGWFDDLTGDAGQVEAFAATWANIQTQLQTSSQELTRKVADLDSLAGEAIDAYRRFQADAAKHLNGAASWAGAMSTGLRVASQVVQLVHDLVRDVLSQLVGSAISWAAEAVFSLGLATPWIIEQVSTRVASWVAKIGGKLTELLTACKKLAGLLGELHALISKAGALFENALRKAAPAVRRTVAGDHGLLDLDELMGGRKLAPPSGREYTLADGSSYTTRWSPEQIEHWTTARDELATALDGSGRSMDDLVDLIHRPTDTLSPDDVAFLKDMREKIGWDDSTVFQKVIPPGESVDRIAGSYKYPADSLQGFVTRLQDVTHFADPKDAYTGLRLDYANSPFDGSGTSPVQMIRYQRGDGAVEVPFNDVIAGHPTGFSDPAPFTGNGFTSSGITHPDGTVVPELYASRGTRVGEGAEMWEVTDSGTYRLLAVLRKSGWMAVDG